MKDNDFKILAAYEDTLHPEEVEERCDHRWVLVGTNKHGSYYKCAKCKAEDEA